MGARKPLALIEVPRKSKKPMSVRERASPKEVAAARKTAARLKGHYKTASPKAVATRTAKGKTLAEAASKIDFKGLAAEAAKKLKAGALLPPPAPELVLPGRGQRGPVPPVPDLKPKTPPAGTLPIKFTGGRMEISYKCRVRVYHDPRDGTVTIEEYKMNYPEMEDPS
jgi:hypothetical protein